MHQQAFGRSQPSGFLGLARGQPADAIAWPFDTVTANSPSVLGSCYKHMIISSALKSSRHAFTLKEKS